MATPLPDRSARADAIRLELFSLPEEPPVTPEEPLLPRVARGEGDAVRACIARYGGLVASLARRFLTPSGDVEDAVQEVFVALWQSAGRFDPAQAGEATFVAMVARRRLIDRTRKQARRPAPESLRDEWPARPTAAALEQSEEARRVLRAIETLREEPRTVLQMALLGGHSHEAIAAATGLPLGTVKSHIRRGLAQVRDLLDTTLPADGGT